MRKKLTKLNDIKQKIEQINIEIQKARSIKKKKELIKYKHRLEKEIMTYMYYRYGIILRKEK